MPDSIVETAKAEWKLTTGVYGEQKEREIDDLSFCITGRQWTDAALAERAATQVGTTQLAARPHPEIDKIAQPMRIVVNQWRNAHLGLNIHPDSEQADKEVAEIIQGRYMKDERDSGAVLARLWGYDRAVKAGVGWYFLGYEFDPTSEHPFDQRIAWQRVPYQVDVYPDPSAAQMDWADGEFMFWPVWLSRDKFLRDFGKSELAKRIASNPQAWTDLAGSEPDWVRGQSNDGSKDAVRVAKYWKKKYTERQAALLDDWSFVYIDKPGTVKKGRKVVQKRVVQEQSLMYYCITGLEDEPLHTAKWNGKYFPLVPVIGEEKQPFDDQRRWEGMVRPAKDPQRTYNWAFANAMEAEALKTKAPRILDPRQIAKYRAWWDQSNIRPFPFLPYDAQIDGQGAVLPPPMVDQADMSKMQGSFMLVEHAGIAIQDATSLYSASLGKDDPRDRSGKAILAKQGQGDEATNGFLQNFLQITLPCEGRIYLDLFPTIYERPGRLLHVMNGEDKKSRRVMVGIPYKMKGDQPERVKAGTKGAKVHDFRKGIYSLEAEAGRSYTSRIQQGQEQWPALIQALGPEAGLVLAPTLLEFSDTPGAPEASKLMRKLRDSKMPFLAEEEGDEPTPDQLKAKLVAQTQMLEQGKQIVAEMGKQIETDQAKQQATMAKAQLDAQVSTQKTESDNAVKIAIAQLESQTKLAIAELQVGQQATATKLEAILGLLKSKAEMMQETRLDDEQGAHEVGMEAMKARTAQAQAEAAAANAAAQGEAQMGHEAGMAAAGADREDERAEAERQFGADQAERDRQIAQQQAGGDE